jgi:homoserine kinase type II
MTSWRGLSWWRGVCATAPSLPAKIPRVDLELKHQATLILLHLPRGIIHGDLFRDNILWDESTMACTANDRWFSPARINYCWMSRSSRANDWCFETRATPAAALNATNTHALLTGSYARALPGQNRPHGRRYYVQRRCALGWDGWGILLPARFGTSYTPLKIILF